MHAIARTQSTIAAPQLALPVRAITFVATALTLYALPLTVPALGMIAALSLAVAFAVMRDEDAGMAHAFAAAASGAMLAFSAVATGDALGTAMLFAGLSLASVIALAALAMLIDGWRGATTAAKAVSLLGGGLLGSTR